jgi:hypothetical protein
MAAITIVLIAVVQGWLLYGLHYAIEHKTWPWTDPSWLLALYAIAVLVPVTLEILFTRLRHWLPWALSGVIALLAIGLALYTHQVAGGGGVDSLHGASVCALYAALFIAWFIALPFVQTYARRGRWASYPDLFEFSWQNVLLLAEAALFTGVFWLLLGLWAALFKVVQITFFLELFSKPAFYYPVTAIVFGYAIYLIEANEKIVLTMRRHLLGVFSWLLPLVALIAMMFMVVLPFTGLKPLWDTGHASMLMLWLQVSLIVFLNSAYQDGQAEPRYPQWLKWVLRGAVLTLPIYAALCAYSLGLRVEQHGWTVSRVWGAIAVAIAGLYGIGYAAAALRRSPWMALVARVNIGIAVVVAVLLLLAVSPVLDPKRLSADSQAARIRSGTVIPAKFDYDYLRFSLERYGNSVLAELAKDPNKQIATLASASLAKDARYEPARSVEPIASRIELHPEGTVLDPAFVQYLEAEAKTNQPALPICLTRSIERCFMVALDLDGDGSPEIMALNTYPTAVYSKVGGNWTKVGVLTGANPSRKQLETLVRESQFKAAPHPWSDVSIGEHRFTVQGVR